MGVGDLQENAEKTKIAAYCRVSTDKEDQLLSLQAQKDFFYEYAQRNHLQLVKLYADEGISGTKLKNRKAFQQMMADAEGGLFQMVFVKDISRLARNVVDFLQSIRRLKALDIGCQFITSNMSLNDGELTLTILAAVAQEESANLSKRVKFGKKKNARLGKVPNLVYGYDKVPGDYFCLQKNEREVAVIRRIFADYLHHGFSMVKIARDLNAAGYRTKKNCLWSQNAVGRILHNRLYIGEVINGKESVADYLTGKRQKSPPAAWQVSKNPQLAVVDEEIFAAVQALLKHKAADLVHFRQKETATYPLSGLIRCAGCGSRFRRLSKNGLPQTAARWVCSGRNHYGASYCLNRASLPEANLFSALAAYCQSYFPSEEGLCQKAWTEFVRIYRPQEELAVEKSLKQQLAAGKCAKQKQLQMFEAEAIDLGELKERTAKLNAQIKECQQKLQACSGKVSYEARLAELRATYFTDSAHLFAPLAANNFIFGRLIKEISVSQEENACVKLHTLNDIAAV